MFGDSTADLLATHGLPRARAHCRFVLSLIHFIPDSLSYSVPLFSEATMRPDPRPALPARQAPGGVDGGAGPVHPPRNPRRWLSLRAWNGAPFDQFIVCAQHTMRAFVRPTQRPRASCRAAVPLRSFADAGFELGTMACGGAPMCALSLLTVGKYCCHWAAEMPAGSTFLYSSRRARIKPGWSGTSSVWGAAASSVRALPGRLSALSVFHSKSLLYGAFI